MQPVTTADGKYKYDKIYFGVTLHELVNDITEYNQSVNGWKSFLLKPGSYGYESYAYRELHN